MDLTAVPPASRAAARCSPAPFGWRPRDVQSEIPQPPRWLLACARAAGGLVGHSSPTGRVNSRSLYATGASGGARRAATGVAGGRAGREGGAVGVEDRRVELPAC
jgi:hypothetical protein